MMELKDTAALMCSDDYKDRFKAEYLQLKIRRDKLAAMLVKWDAGKSLYVPALHDGRLSRHITRSRETRRG